MMDFMWMMIGICCGFFIGSWMMYLLYYKHNKYMEALVASIDKRYETMVNVIAMWQKKL